MSNVIRLDLIRLDLITLTISSLQQNTVGAKRLGQTRPPIVGDSLTEHESASMFEFIEKALR